MQGHEDDSFITFFPNGFICHDGAHMNNDERHSKCSSGGIMYRIQGPFGEQPQAIQQDHVACKNLNSGEAFFIGSQDGTKGFYWIGEGASDDEAGYAGRIGKILMPNATITGF